MDHRTDLLFGRGPATGVGRRVGGVRQVVQVGVFGFVQLQSAGDGIEHAVGHPGQIAPFQLRVIIRADSGQNSDFLAT